ncbi:hypothetical protein EXIGLDRAFT_731271 [Exidia glandulosa HHB12029]|uniref:Uncharacterized protein n=1 Tax=Exidia glandulosa HHB12029 TaxID=1314781 RepID=A0A165L326_EXIGL|nr:hypothetical protein EXIGLDRAFT_731271 [Exidia glandulosa HHB12029]
MPPRRDPKQYTLSLRTHKTLIYLSVPATSPISSLIPRVISAIHQFSDSKKLVPKDVALAKAKRNERRQVVPGEYELLDGTKSVKDSVGNWESVYVMFRDPDGNFKVVVTLPQTLDDDDDAAMDLLPGPSTSSKRKAPSS